MSFGKCKVIFHLFLLPFPQPVTTETRFGPVLYNRHYSSVASLRPVSPPTRPYRTCFLIHITSSSSISSSLLFIPMSPLQLSFLHSLILSVSLCFIPIDLWLILLSLVWVPILIEREMKAHTHTRTVLLTHPCMLILAF